MEFRTLGGSGLVLSEIAYGNWITHGAQIDEEAAHACVRAALDAGITTFDTADVYSETRAESVLGKALAGERREGLVICTKVCHPVGPGPNDYGLSRKHVIEGCEASLRRLCTDYVDVYYAHRYDPQVPLEETMLAFADLVRGGKALYIGVSEWTADQITRAAGLARELRVPLVASQPQYSMLWRVPESQVIPACDREGLGQVVWSPLAQGILTGKYLPGGEPPTGSRAADPTGKGFVDMLVGHWMRDDAVLRAVQELRPVAREAGLTMSQLAIAWVLRNPSVTSAIIGASRPEQVRENVAASGVRLDEAVLTRVDDILAPHIERDPAKTG
ncbi:aldo/keto reductase family protein [Streptomyces huiliensis]|uniref:aldo/keto reductase family protein n=1 Tax=Streptomyces huiliensis TaxID=2876027 RepID=UPI001CC14EF3|nr:aldo/keto reductase family protein [Streptomyces huiliensis]MBZ4322008.1 aldo/keto reductase family protein [Streptomyces huiliensis]